MISYITILLFFIYCWGLGFTVLSLVVKKPELRLERFFLTIGVGLGVFPILAVLLNFLHVMLDWKIFLVLCLVWPMGVLVKKLMKKEFSFPPLSFSCTKLELVLFAVLGIVLFSLFMYASGAFAYPYLEDEDPWGHAVGAKYVALEKRAYDPVIPVVGVAKVDPVLSYIDPYPPAYDVLFGVLHQTSPDLNWTMKFFNALIISLGLLFFFLFAKEFMDDQYKALLATFMLASIPAYLSHFIWAHALGVVLFFPTMYAFWKIREEKEWWLIAGVLVASVWVTQNIELPIKLTMLIVVYLLVVAITSRKMLREEWYALGGGMILSLLWWGAMLFKYGFRQFIRYYTGDRVFADGSGAVGMITSTVGSTSVFHKLLTIIKSVTSSGGSGSRAYSFSDFFFAKSANAINNPIGIGIVVSLLVFLGVVIVVWRYKSSVVEEKNTWICVTLFWLLLLFWGVNGQTFPLSIMRGPFRIWMLLAIPVALLAAHAAFWLKDSFGTSKAMRGGIMGLILLGVVFTSFTAKYDFNTSNSWPTSGSYGTPTQAWEYGKMIQSLPLNSHVFLYAPRGKLVIGLGGYSCEWCAQDYAFRKDIIHRTGEELHTFLKQEGYEYLVLNGQMDAKYLGKVFGQNETEGLLPQRYQEILSSGKFTPVFEKQNEFVLLKVN